MSRGRYRLPRAAKTGPLILMVFVIFVTLADSGCRQPRMSEVPSNVRPAPPPASQAEAASAGASACHLRVVAQPAALRRGDPEGLLIGPPHVRVEGCCDALPKYEMMVDVPDCNAQLKKVGPSIRLHTLADIADARERVQVINVAITARCVRHGTVASGTLRVRVYPRNAALPDPREQVETKSAAPADLSGSAGGEGQSAGGLSGSPGSAGPERGATRGGAAAPSIALTEPRNGATISGAVIIVRGSVHSGRDESPAPVVLTLESSSTILTVHVPLDATGHFAASVLTDQVCTGEGGRETIVLRARYRHVSSAPVRVQIRRAPSQTGGAEGR